MTKIKSCLRYTFKTGLRIYHDLSNGNITTYYNGTVNHKTLQYNKYKDKTVNIDREILGDRLKEHQKEGIIHCLNGGMLHMETGTGKTFTTLTLCQLKTSHVPSLLICSKTNIGNWINEIKKFYPNLPYLVLHNDYNSQAYHICEHSTLEYLSSNVLVITTEHVLRKYFNKGVQCLIDNSGERFSPQNIEGPMMKYRYTRNVNMISNVYNIFFCSKWDWIIVDESHNFRNKTSIKTKALLALFGHKYLCLTGTPIIKSRDDLMSQFVFLGMDPFINKSEFQGNEVPLYHYKTEDEYVEHYNEVLVDQDELQYEIGNLCLANWLDKTETSPSVTSYLAFFQKMSYIAGCCWNTNTKIDVVDELSMNDSLMYSNKIKEVQRICSEHQDSSIVIFTSLIKHRTCIQRYLDGAITLGSDTPNRQGLIKAFQQKQFRILITSYAICSEALNFQHANVCILFNPLWNIPQEQQAIARVKRQGQTQKIFIYKLITENSFDQVLVNYQMKKAISNNIKTNMTLDNARDIITRLKPIADNINYRIFRSVNPIDQIKFPGIALWRLYRKRLNNIFSDIYNNVDVRSSSEHIKGLIKRRCKNFNLCLAVSKNEDFEELHRLKHIHSLIDESILKDKIKTEIDNLTRYSFFGIEEISSLISSFM